MDFGKLKSWSANALGRPGDVSAAVPTAPASKLTRADVAAVPLARFSAADRKLLLSLARLSITSLAEGNPPPTAPISRLPAPALEKRGCFVTLTYMGSLRGCMGSVMARQPLFQAIIENARSAASRDPRFAPVTATELGRLQIEVSVLTKPEPLSYKSVEDLLSQLHPYQDGVVLQAGFCLATFLPQVWAFLPDKTGFLDQLSRKAGCDPLVWRRGEATISTYQTESFHEPEAAQSFHPAG